MDSGEIKPFFCCHVETSPAGERQSEVERQREGERKCLVSQNQNNDLNTQSMKKTHGVAEPILKQPW